MRLAHQVDRRRLRRVPGEREGGVVQVFRLGVGTASHRLARREEVPLAGAGPGAALGFFEFRGQGRRLFVVGDAQPAAQVEMDAIIAPDQPEDAHPNILRIAFAMELAQRGVDRPALSLYEAAHRIRPLPDRIQAHVKALKKRLDAQPEKDPADPAAARATNPAYQLKVRLANRLARLRGLMRRLRKS